MTSTVGLSTLSWLTGVAPSSAAAPTTAQPLEAASASVRGMLLQRQSKQQQQQQQENLSADDIISTATKFMQHTIAYCGNGCYYLPTHSASISVAVMAAVLGKEKMITGFFHAHNAY